MWAGMVKSWHQGRRSGHLCPLLPRILSIRQRDFQEICFPLEADHFHPFKRVANFVVSLVAEGNQESVGADLDVVTHY